MQQTLERAAEDAQPGLELGAIWVSLVRALQEIEDPGGDEHDGYAVGECGDAEGRKLGGESLVEANTA